MSDEDGSARDEAPDLKILGDQITFQPSGVEPAGKDEEKDGPLMKPLGRFRSDPLK